MPYSNEFLNYLMSEALSEARLAASAGEVPIGCVIAKEEKIIARAHNQIESTHDATAHAECLAIRTASKVIHNWRLLDCLLCVTLKPCMMCVGALQLSRIPTLIFGADTFPFGGAAPAASPSMLVDFEVVSGIMKSECEQVLKDFFKQRRMER